ncbi:MAG: hypothetical protein LBJ38_01190 [Oscillospiraceae bacterium]|nr:hypothetical protein [Oscillospiraceae bacterium]
MKKQHKEGKISVTFFLSSLSLVVVATMSAVMVVDFARFNKKLRSASNYEGIFLKLYELDGIVRSKFNGKIDDDALIAAIRKGYIAGLSDQGCRYLSPEEYEQVMREQQGPSLPCGVRFVADGGCIRVAEIYDEAWLAADLRVHDLIVRVNDIDVVAANIDDCLSILNSPDGTKVSILLRRGVDELKKDLVIRQIGVSSLKKADFGDVGYIKILTFNEQVQKELPQQLSALTEEKSAIIIDLRNTATGSLECVAETLQWMLPQGLIVSAIYSDGKKENLFYSDGNHEINKPVIVLGNSKTSGVAELFIQVLCHYKKALFVGEQTAGNGKIQVFFELQDGSAVELPTAKYGLPDGKAFDGVGPTPNFVVSLSAPMSLEPLDLKNDEQLRKALEVLATKN